jgi:AraC family transcriptional regulator, exoenzyme S synthesis regulatory protein ExsA
MATHEVCDETGKESGRRMSRRIPNNLEEWLALAYVCSFRATLLANELRISQRQLQRVTGNIFGRSPQAWLSERRLAMAGALLKKHRSVKFVAFELGFKQASHFSREFKSRHGISPRTYLERCDDEALSAKLKLMSASRGPT